MSTNRWVLAVLWVAALLALPGLAGCSMMTKSTPVEGQERQQITAAVEPMADHLFSGLNAGDYAAFSRDFDDRLKKSMNEKAFQELKQMFDPRIGKYQSRQMDRIERMEGFLVVSYTAFFEKDEIVDVRLTLSEGEPMQISGLWFDSPNLRK